MRSIALTVLCTILLTGCKARLGQDEGYSDGYAAGYNTECQIRATLVHGEWDNAKYKAGYDAGYAAGAADCRRARNQGRSL